MNFINGMTLLYGDLSLLADAARKDLQLASERCAARNANVCGLVRFGDWCLWCSVTPLSSPTTMFDGSPPR